MGICRVTTRRQMKKMTFPVLTTSSAQHVGISHGEKLEAGANNINTKGLHLQYSTTQRSPARDRNELYSALVATTLAAAICSESLKADTFYNCEMSSCG